MKTNANINYKQAKQIIEQTLQTDPNKVAIHFDYPYAYIWIFPGAGRCRCIQYNISETTAKKLVEEFKLETM